MNFFFISEHYKPRLGGVTTYVDKTCKTLASKGHQVTLAVPGENSINTIETTIVEGVNVVSFGTDINLKGNISSDIRIHFSKAVFEYLNQQQEDEKPDIIHVLFGLYLMKHFPIQSFQKKNIKVGVTVHNIPPEECGLSWKGDKIFPYVKDRIRKELIRFVNKRRLTHQNFDYYIVPSNIVKDNLSKHIAKNKITTIGHGGVPFELVPIEEQNSSGNNKLRLLTVAGFIPHKNQHLIPEIAAKLMQENVNIQWDVVGPNKHSAYVEYIQAEIKQRGLSDAVNLHFSVPFDTLKELYQKTDIYIQLSSEEGFCITTLDAGYCGIPIVGTRAGAIPEIIELGKGITVGFGIEEIATAIKKIHLNQEDYEYKESDLSRIKKHFSWDLAIENLLETVG